MIEQLKWDSEFFGRKIGRLTKVQPEKKLRSLIQQAHKKGYEYLSCRLILTRIAEIQLLEKHGFYLTDIGVVWEKRIQYSTFNTQHPTFLVREATVKDAPMLKSMVRGLFKDSRFFNDPFFTKKEADKVYQAWIENSLNDKTVKTFLIKDCGFITCQKISKNKGDISLVGVIPRRQDEGIGQRLMYEALKWFKKAGVKALNVRTQSNNISAMNFYTGLGFRVKYVDMTMGMILNGER